jgi:hypothetical protein
MQMQKKIFGKIEKFVEMILKKILNNGSLAKKMLKESKSAMKENLKTTKKMLKESAGACDESELPKDVPLVECLEVMLTAKLSDDGGSVVLAELKANEVRSSHAFFRFR